MAEQKQDCGCKHPEKSSHGHGRHSHKGGCCNENHGQSHGNHKHGNCGCGHNE